MPQSLASSRLGAPTCASLTFSDAIGDFDLRDLPRSRTAGPQRVSAETQFAACRRVSSKFDRGTRVDRAPGQYPLATPREDTTAYRHHRNDVLCDTTMTPYHDAMHELDLRISDVDRDNAAQLLHRSVGEGRISWAEHEERLTGVYAARTRSDLVRAA